MAKGILAQAAAVTGFKIVARSSEVWRAEIDWVGRGTCDADLLGHIGLAGQRADAASSGSHIVHLGLVDHARTYRPGVVQRQCHGFHGFGQISNRKHIVMDNILASPGISAPQIHIWLEDVINSAGGLIVIRRNTNYTGEIIY